MILMKCFILVSMLYLVSCGNDAPTIMSDRAIIYSHPQEREIEMCILEMLGNDVNPFLIIEDSSSGKYVQFYNEDGQIYFDLPEVQLNEQERKLAKEYFDRHEIKSTSLASKDPDTGDLNEFRSWNKLYSESQFSMVTKISLGALFEVVGINGETKLTLTKGWE